MATRRKLNATDSGSTWLALCGVEVLITKRKTKETPHRPPCGCLRGFSNSETCHHCACVLCAKERARYHRSIAAGGLLGAQRKKRHGNRAPKTA